MAPNIRSRYFSSPPSYRNTTSTMPQEQHQAAAQERKAVEQLLKQAEGEHGAAVMRRRPKTKMVCTLGPASRSVEMIERLLRAGLCVARFNFSHGSHEYHQETLDNLRAAMDNTGILCAVMLDTKTEEYVNGQLKNKYGDAFIRGTQWYMSWISKYNPLFCFLALLFQIW